MGRGGAARGGAGGFTLVEAAVAVGVVSILAGMAAPLALRALDSHREAATRKALRRAFEALFGARDRRVASLRGDFGFRPDRSFGSLPFLVSRCWGAVPPFGAHDGASFFWGYNGPYWQGPVRDGVPVDAWGNPIGLRYLEGEDAWQVHSPGAPGRGQPLVYPPVPAPESSLRASITVVLARSKPDSGCTVTLRSGGNGEAVLASQVARIPGGDQPYASVVFQAPAGLMEVIVAPEGDARPVTVPLDLLPGGSRVLEVRP